MEIDHVFVMGSAPPPLPAWVVDNGLVEQYRRVHSGQGTSNVCYAFDNLYLELLWVHDVADASSPAIIRTGLLERSLWRTMNACPFGLAWRLDDGAKDDSAKDSMCLHAPHWAFRPAWLPDGLSIAVATDSDDTEQPWIFESPDAHAPLDWPAERSGSLQHAAGLGEVTRITLTLPSNIEAAAALRKVAASTQLEIHRGSAYGMAIEVQHLDGSGYATIQLN